MFDDITLNNKTVHNNTQTINEASTGQLVKISKTSKLARFKKGSFMEKWFFSDEPYFKKNIRSTREEHGMLIPYDEDVYYDIDILQVLVFGDNEYLIEYELGEKRW